PSRSRRPCGQSPRRRSARTCRAPSGPPCGPPRIRSSSPSSCPCSRQPFPPPSHAPFRSKLVTPAPRRPTARTSLGLAPRRDQVAHALPAELSDLLIELDPPLGLHGQATFPPTDQAAQPSGFADGHSPLATRHFQFGCRTLARPIADLPPPPHARLSLQPTCHSHLPLRTLGVVHHTLTNGS